MNCPEVRDQLSALLYGDLLPADAARLEDHLSRCPTCRRELEALRRVRAALDAVSVPAVQVNLGRLYQEAARRQARRAQRWRWTALAGCAAAAMALMIVGLRLEVRLGAHEVVVHWGEERPMPPADPGTALAAGRTDPDGAANGEERLRLLSNLIHALAEEAQVRDQLQQQQFVRLEARLDRLQLQDNVRWKEAERYVTALLVNQSAPPKKGE
jgi:hypothetical protein